MFLLFKFVLVVWEVSVKGREECISVRREWCGGVLRMMKGIVAIKGGQCFVYWQVCLLDECNVEVIVFEVLLEFRCFVI